MRNTKWGTRLGARFGAIIISAALAFGSLSGTMPGGVAFAESDVTAEVNEVDVVSGEADSSAEDVSEEAAIEVNADATDATDDEADANADVATSSAAVDGSTSSDEENVESSIEEDAGAAEISLEEVENVNLAFDDVALNASTVDEKIEQVDVDKVDTEGNYVVVTGRSFDYNKTDVWDFGAPNLGSDYNNRLDVKTINSLYPGVKAGTEGKYLPSFSLDDGSFEFFAGDNIAKLYSTNESITRYATGSAGSYSGYLSCTKTTNEDPYIILDCQGEDVVKIFMASDAKGKNPEIKVEPMDSQSKFHVYYHGDQVWIHDYDSGRYKIYSENGYLGIAKIERIHDEKARVYTGIVKGYDKGPFFIRFNEIKAPVINGRYVVLLEDRGEYSLSVGGITVGDYDYDIEYPQYEYRDQYYSIIEVDSDDDVEMEIGVIPLQQDLWGEIYEIPDEYKDVFAENTEIEVCKENSSFKRVVDVEGYTDYLEYDFRHLPYGSYILTLRSKKDENKVYARYKVEVPTEAEDESFNIYANYGDYRTRDNEARIICDVEGIDSGNLSDAVFWFTYPNNSDGTENNDFRTADYEYYELASGLLRLPKNQTYVMHASGLPDGLVLDSDNMKRVVLDKENCPRDEYHYTIKLKEEELVDVKRFGAKGDGVTDDTEAIKNAILSADGRRVRVPAGKYCVNSIEVSNISLDMYSAGDAWFIKTDAEAAPIIQFNDCKNVSIKGIGFDGGTKAYEAGVSSACLHFEEAANIAVTNCKFKNCAVKSIAFFNDVENINVSNNSFENASGLMWFGKGTAKHVTFENNFANGGKKDAIVIGESKKAADSFDINICNNVFQSFSEGSAIQIRGASGITIKNNTIDNCKYFIMSPRPYSKKFTEPQVYDMTVSGNSGKAGNFAYLYTYEENPNTLYKNLIFTNNVFEATSGMTMYACDGVSFTGDQLTVSGSSQFKICDSQNVTLNNVMFGAKKASKALFKFDACDEVKFKGIDFTADRALLQVLNSDNAHLSLDNVRTNFTKLENNVAYADNLRVDCKDCTNSGKELKALYQADKKTVMLPVIGDKFAVTASEDVHIATVHSNLTKAGKVTLSCDTNDVYFEKGGNVLVNDSVRFGKGSIAELEFNGKKWSLKSIPVTIKISGDVEAAVGDKAQFTVSVAGGSGSYEYRWFQSANDGKTWSKSSYSGAKKVTLSTTVTEAMYQYSFRCRVKDKGTGTEYYSDAVKILKPAGFIKTQPKDCRAKVGENAIYTVEVNGKAKSYQWYKSKDGGKVWQKLYCTGARTSKLEIPVEKYMNNYLIYCVIKDADGNEHSTETAKIIIEK